MTKPRALLSVSDKTGIQDLARELVNRGWEIVSTGGTARAIRDAGVEVMDISDVTGHPEMMDGRVKTLHPAVHAGLLARRDLPDHMEAMEGQGYQTIDLVAVNLYPFLETIARPDVTLAEAVEQIDIGGPTMIRSAAKNYPFVYVVVDPADYPWVLEAVDGGGDPDALRLELATKVFQHTGAMDNSFDRPMGQPNIIHYSANSGRITHVDGDIQYLGVDCLKLLEGPVDLPVGHMSSERIVNLFR